MTRMLSKTFIQFFVAFSLLDVATVHLVNGADFKTTIEPFLKSHCVRCHGLEKQQGDRRFDRLSLDFTNQENGEQLQEILDQLNLGEMPPEDEPQPSAARVRQVVQQLTALLHKARETARAHSGRVVLRRLNRTEYFNTVRDLFDLNMTDFDPTIAFPVDESVEGFDNIGEGLLTSNFLLAQYLEAAEQIVDKAIRPGPRPKMVHLVSRGDEIHGGGILDPRGFKRALVRDQFTRAFVKRKFNGVDDDGEYILRVKTNTVRWQGHRFDVDELGYDPNETPRIRVLVVSRSLGAVATRVLGEFDIRDGDPVELEIHGYLQQGYEFAVEWANGPRGSQKRIMRKVFPKYLPQDTIPLARNPVEMYLGAAPELRLHRLELEGPYYPQWPLPGFTRFFSDIPSDPGVEYLRKSLTRFASRAFRRPVERERLEPYVQLAMGRFSETRDFWAAVKFAMRAMLASPSFLYLIEPAKSPLESNVLASLSNYELASRLSYFLWSSMPDDELSRVAAAGDLRKPDVIKREIERMLNDSKSEAFEQNFPGQWLNLRKLGEMPPDPESNKSYYADNLEAAMRQETRLLFQHLLRQNLNILRFIDADFTFLNPALARHYGLEELPGDDFRRVRLKPEQHRAGLLGHGSVLTLTSNGVETQPVVRGVWVLENLLGTPPSPPPPDVQPVEPDIRGATTIRELLAKHRTIATCNECHRKIDPIGLALENFDHLGRYRSRYKKHSMID
ncbi:MAG TPA: DUF1592 domain-containing protein, partial [Planctomycetes bacterium]|nr:DUF1592 domain-containing protein [Planctomycetota bacterium]